jgi:hypothetical protein
MKDRQGELPLDDDGIGNADEKCPDHRDNDERQMRVAEAVCDRPHPCLIGMPTSLQSLSAFRNRPLD